MSHKGYTIGDLSSSSRISLSSLPQATFIGAQGLSELMCHDMYGPLPLGLFCVPNAIICGDEGYIYTNNGPILEQNADFLRHGRFLKPRLEEKATGPQPVQKISSLISLISRRHNYFWHWMMDSLPKVLVAERSGFSGAYLIPDPGTAAWARESLELVGISSNRLLVSNGEALSVENLYVPTYFCGYNLPFNPEFATIFRDWIRSHIAPDPRRRAERILIMRSHEAQQRRVINQEDLARVAQECSFKPIYFERLPLREQLSLACHAEAIIGAHGSGLTHALFMKDGGLVVELFPYKRQRTNDCYEQIAKLSNHHYQLLESESDLESCIQIDPITLKKTLLSFFSSNF